MISVLMESAYRQPTIDTQYTGGMTHRCNTRIKEFYNNLL